MEPPGGTEELRTNIVHSAGLGSDPGSRRTRREPDWNYEIVRFNDRL